MAFRGTTPRLPADRDRDPRAAVAVLVLQRTDGDRTARTGARAQAERAAAPGNAGAPRVD